VTLLDQAVTRSRTTGIPSFNPKTSIVSGCLIITRGQPLSLSPSYAIWFAQRSHEAVLPGIPTSGRLALVVTVIRMARRTIPVVEVTDPDGIKSFWVAFAIPHDRAVAAVQDRLSPGHTAELAGRRPPDSRKLKGARKGDIIKLEHDANSALRIESFTSARSARLATSGKSRRRHSGDLKETVSQLLATARNMPPGQKRQDALIEIGRLRNRMYVLLRSAGKSKFRDSGGS